MTDFASTARGIERRRYLMGGGALAVAAGLSELLTPRRIQAPHLRQRLDALVSRSFSGWKADANDDAPPETLAEPLYDQIVCRDYVAGGAPSVTAFIGYAAAQRGLTRMHQPPNCFEGSGYTINNLKSFNISVGSDLFVSGASFSAQRGDEFQQVLYWSRIGTNFVHTPSEQNWAVTWAALHGTIPDGVLFRLSCLDDGTQAALGLLESFARELVSDAPPDLRRVLLG